MAVEAPATPIQQQYAPVRWLAPIGVIDERILAWVQARRSPQSDAWAVYAKMLGDGRYTLPPTMLLYFVAMYLKWQLGMDMALFAFVNFFFAGTITQVLHIFTRRHRPDRGEGPLIFEGFHLRSKHRSFPSGHSTVSWALFSIYGLLSWPTLWPMSVIAFGLACTTSYSRLNDNAHWPSDVISGSLIGLGTAIVMVSWL